MKTKAAVITAASIGPAAGLLLAPQSGSQTRRMVGQGIWWCLRAIGGNVKTGGRAVGQASWRAGGKLTSFARRGGGPHALNTAPDVFE